MAKSRIILGVDYGDARTGIAVSDPSGIIATGLSTIHKKGKREVSESILEICRERGVELIVVGNPINMNGTEGERSIHIKNFASYLEELTGIEVVLFDERCTTMAAHQILNMTDTRGKKRKNVVDTLSAQIILQNYMDSHK